VSEPPEPARDHEVARDDGGGARSRRPLVERVGMAAIAALMAALFGGVAVAAWVGGEPFLAAMGAIGCLMTGWVGAITLFRG
jgi:hypothetical protein